MDDPTRRVAAIFHVFAAKTKLSRKDRDRSIPTFKLILAIACLRVSVYEFVTLPICHGALFVSAGFWTLDGLDGFILVFAQPKLRTA